MSKPKILVVFKDNSCTEILGKFLAYVRYLSSDQEEVKLEGEIDIKEGDYYDYHISTKYYDADVQFVFFKYHPDDVDDMIQSVENLNSIIYLFKETEDLDKFFKFIETMSDKAPAEISMLIYDSPDEKMPDKYEKSVNQLSIDYFVEFIRTDIEAGYERKEGEKDGMLGETKVGMHRVVEAFQCNMWDNMVRKPTIPQTVQKVSQEKETIKEEIETKDEKVPETTTGQDTHDATDQVQTSTEVDTTLKNSSEPYPFDFENEERNLEELGSLMSQMRDLKMNIQNMTTEERRSNAEQMIK